MKIIVIIGTRPNFIGLAPVIHELNKTNCEITVCHTGQHYDKEMSDIFLDQLDIPSPKYNLHSGGGSHAKQTARIITRFEDILIKDNPDLVVVEGDTTTAFASSLAAAKLNVPIVHIEAGCRSFDKTLPEEINRIVISHVADMHFPPTPNCKANLLREGMKRRVLGPVGHPIVDSIYLVKEKLKKIKSIGRTTINNHGYCYVTLHRDFNVDDPVRLKHILVELDKVAAIRQVIFAIHPRTRKRINKFGLANHLHNFIKLKPVDYITSLSLIKHAYAILSDSGGLTKESCILGTPGITFRPNTEWVEVFDGYSNQLAFKKGNSISSCLKRLERNYDLARNNLKSLQGTFGSVGVSKKVADHIAISNQ
jgi:UDP-N-acetylglucosamine 2-epimerase